MVDRREFLKAGPLLSCVSLTAPPQGRGDWLHKSPRVFLVDFQVPDPVDQSVPGMAEHFFQKLDVERLVDELNRAHVNVILTHAKCHEGNAYYNTRAGHKHSDLGGRDLMAEFSRLCRARGLALLFYYAMSMDHRAFTEHPDYRMRDARGRDVVRKSDNPLLLPRHSQRWLVCLNGPYRRYVKAMLGELSRGYDFDGFWLDVPRFEPCYCDACKASYGRDTGAEFPAQLLETDEARAYIRWRYDNNAQIMRDFFDLVHSANPRLTVAYNGTPFRSWETGDEVDYVSREYHYKEGPIRGSLNSRKQRAAKPGTPFEMMVWRFAYPGRGVLSQCFQVRNTPALLTEMAAVVAHGGFPQYYDQIRPDGTLDGRSLDVLRPAMEAVKLRQGWGGVGEPVPYALILWSKATEGYAPHEARLLHEDAVEGVHSALVESHIPVGVITERDVAAGRWRGARVLVAPSAECMSAGCIAGLEKFVRAGGGLVVTNRSSLRDEEGVLRDNFGLAGLLGVDYTGMTEHLFTFYTLDRRHPVTDHLPLDFPTTVVETLQTRVRTHAREAALGTITYGMPGFTMGTIPHQRTAWPSLTAREHERGRVVYASAALGAMYKRFSHADTRQLIVNAVKWAAGGPPPVTAQAPETVEMIPWRDERGKRTIIHVLNRTGAGLAQGEGAMMHEVIPVHDITLRVKKGLGGNAAKAQPGDRPLPVRWEGDEMHIRLGRVDIWEIVVIG